MTAAPVSEAAPLLAIRHLTKVFPGTVALDDLSIEIRSGEVHAVVGHNGSGKSTLVKCMSGYHIPEDGVEVAIRGQDADIAELTGLVSFVHQDLGLILELSAVENLALRSGFFRTRLGAIDVRRHRSDIRGLLNTFGLELDIDAPLSMATPVERTIVALAGSLQHWERPDRVLVLDEPTAILPPHEVSKLLDVVRRLRERGAGVLYISHRLSEVFEIADRVTVLRGGRRIGEHRVVDLTEDQLITEMVGKVPDLGAVASRPVGAEDAIVRVGSLHGRYLRGVSFDLNRGEIVGVAGLPSSGRDELPRILAGKHDWAVRGSIISHRQPERAYAARRWRGAAVAIVPADRVRAGVISVMSVIENASLSALHKIVRLGAISPRLEGRFYTHLKSETGLVAAGASASIASLSGGNQQKVVIGRALAADPDVLVLSEPTAGVDIGAKYAIYELVSRAAAQGTAVLVTSTDIDDLIRMCSRVLVLDKGVLTGELRGKQINANSIVQAMEGAHA